MFGNWLRAQRRERNAIESPALIPVAVKPAAVSAEVLLLRCRGTHVLELPMSVSPYWLGESHQGLAELDRLNLDTAPKQQVTDLVQTLLLDQSRQAQQTITFQEIKIQALTLELAHLRRIRLGKKHEALAAMSPRQLCLFEDTLLADIAFVEAEIEQIDSTPKTNTARLPRARAGRQPLPDHLPRIEHRHEPASGQYEQCGCDLVKIREDITEQLDVEPARFFVHRHIRPQYGLQIL